MRRSELALEGDARSVPQARRFVEGALESWDLGSLAWSACLVVSELATNAALHAGTPFSVVVAVEDELVRIEVRDGSVRLPRRRTHGMESTTGRGLRLVAELCVRWGVEPTAGGAGKAVWALLAAPPAAGEQDDDGADVDVLLAAFSDDVDEPGVAGSGRAPVSGAA